MCADDSTCIGHDDLYILSQFFACHIRHIVGVAPAVAVADAYNGVIVAADTFLHKLDKFIQALFSSSDLADGDQSALVVNVEDRSYAEDGACDGSSL